MKSAAPTAKMVKVSVTARRERASAITRILRAAYRTHCRDAVTRKVVKLLLR